MLTLSSPQVEQLEDLYLGQSWSWDQQQGMSGSDKIALEYDLQPGLPDVFTLTDLAEDIGLNQTDIGPPAPLSTKDEERQWNALRTFQQTRQQHEEYIQAGKKEWKDEVIRIQEERKKNAYDNIEWSWSNWTQAFKHSLGGQSKPLIVPSIPTIACCPY